MLTALATIKGRAIARAVCPCSSTPKARVWYRASPCGIYGRRVALEDVFLRVLRFPPVIILPVLHTRSFICNRSYLILAIKSIVKQRNTSLHDDHSL